jgi:hypothetical protein
MTKERVDRSLAFVVRTGHRRSLGFARDDKKERVVVRTGPLLKDKAVVGAGNPLATAPSFSNCPLLHNDPLLFVIPSP